jgi:hypothetical protein
MSTRLCSTGAAILSAALVLMPGTALGATFGPASTLRSTPAGQEIVNGDVASDGDRLVAGWQEQAGGILPRVFMRWSVDGGATWAPRFRIDTRASQQVAVSACGAWAWVASTLHEPADPPATWIATLTGREPGTAHLAESALSTSGAASAPDIACAGGRRLAIAWFQQDGGTTHVRFHTRGPSSDPSVPAWIDRDLGAGDADRGLAVAATPSLMLVAWYRGASLRIARFAIGAAPRVPVTRLPDTVAPAWAGDTQPRMAAVGGAASRVAPAWSRGAGTVGDGTYRADLVIAHSSDSAASFGAPRTLVHNAVGTATYATAVDRAGTTLLVETRTQHDFVSADWQGFGLVSTDSGAHWTRTPPHLDAAMAGALSRAGGMTRIAETWSTVSLSGVWSLRFHAGRP